MRHLTFDVVPLIRQQSAKTICIAFQLFVRERAHVLERLQHGVWIVVRHDMKMRMGEAATECEERHRSASKRPLQRTGKSPGKCEHVGMFMGGKLVKLYDMPLRHDHAMPEAERFAV